MKTGIDHIEALSSYNFHFNHYFCRLVVVSTVYSLILSSCITPLDVTPSDFENTLVVEGFIDDDFGPHAFRVSRLARFAGIRDDGATPNINAQVRIIDQNGQVTPVERESAIRKDVFIVPPGCGVAVEFVQVLTNYRTPKDFKGEIGNTYILEVISDDNKVYRSQPQTLDPTPPVDSLHLVFKELPSLDPVVKLSGVEVIATWQDPPEETNYYFWRINGTYRIATDGVDRPAGACCSFDPRDNGARDCWIVENNRVESELAFTDSRNNGQQISLPVGFIPDDGLRFASRLLPADKIYHVEVEQYAISKEAFDFNTRLKVLSEIDGELFDPPPVGIRGNIFNVDDPEEKVIGFFGAFAVQKRGIFIPESLLEFKQRFPSPCGDCRVRQGARTEVPEPYR